MKVAVVGGKGGTGKTIIAVNVACALARESKTLLIDADVDNPCALNTMRALKIELIEEHQITKFKPMIDKTKCNNCGECVNVCPEHALVSIPGTGIILVETLCAGCGCCMIVCNQGAIIEQQVPEAVVRYYRTELPDLLVGELLPGHRRSFVVITRLIEDYKELFSRYENVIIDSPPGTGAGVFAILRNSDKVIIVTEPTPLGIADFTKLLKLIKRKFSEKKGIVVINKSTLNRELCYKIREICLENSIEYVELPYSKSIVNCYVMGIPVILHKDVEKEVVESIEHLVKFVKE